MSVLSSEDWPDAWGTNFAFPLDIDRLKSDRISLTHFIPRIHAAPFVQAFSVPNGLPYFPDDLSTLPRFLSWLKYYFGSDENVLFAITDLATSQFAGVIGIIKTSPSYLTAEVGPVMIFPSFRRTHVSTHAIGLVFSYCLELPPQGLGLRRLQWTTDSVENDASTRVAERMGMKKEGVMRCAYIITSRTAVYQGRSPREHDPVRGGSTDSVLLAICYDDWEEGVRDRVRSQMARKN
jgi:RimJ/RimL family protein N-acetyltransferase